jgi:hypothetical protein
MAPGNSHYAVRFGDKVVYVQHHCWAAAIFTTLSFRMKPGVHTNKPYYVKERSHQHLFAVVRTRSKVERTKRPSTPYGDSHPVYKFGRLGTHRGARRHPRNRLGRQASPRELPPARHLFVSTTRSDSIRLQTMPWLVHQLGYWQSTVKSTPEHIDTPRASVGFRMFHTASASPTKVETAKPDERQTRANVPGETVTPMVRRPWRKGTGQCGVQPG